AARLLGKFGPSIIDDLIPLLHGHWWPRANQFSPPPQVLVEGQRYDVRRLPAHQFSPSPQAMAANIALQSIGARAVPRLIELLAHEDRFVATSASTALERIRPPAVPALSQAVSSRNDQVINYAANALGRLGRGAKAALPTLLEVAASEEHSHLSRVAAAGAALRIDASTSRESKAIQATIPLLIRLLEHGSFADQGRAAEILQGIGPPARDALPALRERLKTPPPDDGNADISARAAVARAAKAAIAAIEAESDEE
ncbi:MAG: HEAT repeat domain-containing protein, partial [Pirellulales bacterium]